LPEEEAEPSMKSGKSIDF